MKFRLEVDIDQSAWESTSDELGRILRYWAGNLKHYPMAARDHEAIYDSAYKEVGSWEIS